MSVVPTDTVTADSGLADLAPGEAAGVAGQGCHAGKDEMKRAAAAAGKSEVLDRYARACRPALAGVSAAAEMPLR